MSDLQTAAEALLYVIDRGSYSQGEYLDAVKNLRDAVNGVVDAPAPAPVAEPVPAPVEAPAAPSIAEAAAAQETVDPLAPAPADAEAVSGN